MRRNRNWRVQLGHKERLTQECKKGINMNRATVMGLENREEVFAYIVRYINKHTYAPSVKEIADGVGISREAARRHVIWLIEDGYLQTDTNLGESRAYRVAETRVVKKGRRKCSETE